MIPSGRDKGRGMGMPQRSKKQKNQVDYRVVVDKGNYLQLEKSGELLVVGKSFEESLKEFQQMTNERAFLGEGMNDKGTGGKVVLIQ